MLIYLSGDIESKLKSDVNNSQSQSHEVSEPLVGGETVFYGPRNSLVAEVSFDSYIFCTKIASL